ncbi:UPF0711 protein C18orf21 homolog [Brachyhypopomus gauderio]|uniref:UPF0711 protein C18orf21 homolog n=1 Tax=Brachyhypopomus gauderio TaxID=698409 RepID=UPI0040426640
MVAKNLCSKTQRFLSNASILYRDTCPEQARFLMQRHQMNGPPMPDSELCPYCFQWRQPGEYHVRVRPKRAASPQVRKLLRWEAANRRLSAQQTKVLNKFRRSSSVLMATCHSCNKTSKQPGLKREFLEDFSKLTSTPVIAGTSRTPQPIKRPASMSGSYRKTPRVTPTSASCQTPSLPRSVIQNLSGFSRLKKILMLAEMEKNKTGSLKDFLTSL